MSTPPLFRQSFAKTLLTDCPALLRRQMVSEGRKASKAMNAGSLLDYLVFEQSGRYEIVDARYRSGPRQGEPCTDWMGKDAQVSRDDILARGLLPVLEAEVQALRPTADAIVARIRELARDMAGGYTFELLYQPHMTWTTELGVESEGTPDVLVVVEMRDLFKVCSIDVKHTGFLPQKRMAAQVFNMGWDVQGAAYREGSRLWIESERCTPALHMDHVILASSSLALGLPPVARRLSPIYLEIGKRRWEKAQRCWQQCLATGEWPGYSEDELQPSHFHVRTLEEYDESQFTETEEP